MSVSQRLRLYGAEFSDRLNRTEVLVLRPLARLRKNPCLGFFFALCSRLGDGPLWAAVALTLLLFGQRRERLAVAAASVTAVLAASFFCNLKKIVKRRRPFELWPELTCLVRPPDRYSFPSGHTMTAFSLYGTFATLLPGYGWIFGPAAVLIGLSRVFLGAHYPSDVLAGGFLGAVLGHLVAQATLFYIG